MAKKREADETVLLAELAAVVELRETAEERERELVEALRARARPTSWARIGAVYRLTGEAVRKRFSPRAGPSRA
jgi:uncharacterized membrane protein